jgi:hypothetical protein
LLDINQKASSPLLSLDELRIYAADTNVLSGYDALAETLGGYSPLYDLDSAGDVTVKLNYRLNSGSGSGDVLVLIPDSAFDGQPADSFVYLYSKFGCNYKGNAGFEEWAVRTPSVAPTGPGSLSGYVYFDANKDGDRDTGELGFGGIRMQLQQTNALGEIVVLDEVTTNTDGFYSFPNLQPGTYSIVQIDEPTVTPDGNPLLDGVNSIGTLESGEIREFDGVTADGILNIVVGVGQNGENYNFGEVEDIPN